MNECTIIVRNEVKCKVTGLNDEDMELLVSKYGVLVPSRFHMPKFKLGLWDGKINFFTRSGETYVNLLDEIIEFLTIRNYSIKISDKRKLPPFQAPVIDKNYFSDRMLDGKPLILREHQVRVINALTNAVIGVAIAATGAGKTFITGALTRIYEELDGLRTLTVVPNKTLVRQTHREYVDVLGLDAGILYGEEKNTDAKHLVSTWQSLKNNSTLLMNYDVVIVDEVHASKALILQNLLLESGKDIQYRFGVTGTLPDTDVGKMAVRIAVGPLVEHVPALELIEKNILADINIEIVTLQHNMHQLYMEYKDTFVKSLTIKKPVNYATFKKSYLPNWQSERAYNAKHDPHVNYICSDLERLRDSRGNILCLVDGVAQGEYLADHIEGAYFLSGRDSAAARDAVYSMYADRDDIILICTGAIASTGLNIKRIFTLAFVNYGKSGVKVIQSVGRGLRVAADKEDILIMDYTNDLKYSTRHTAERVKLYDTAGYPYTKKKINFSDTPDIFD